MRNVILAVLLALALGGCAQPAPQEVYVRGDWLHYGETLVRLDSVDVVRGGTIWVHGYGMFPDDGLAAAVRKALEEAQR